MHELSIALSIVEAVEEEAVLHSGPRQRDPPQAGTSFRRGAGSSRHAFELAREGTTLSDSRLVIEEMPIVVYCPTCEAQQTVTSMQWFCCPVCNTPVSEVVQGRELQVVALEME